jgi:PAS domain S-box-containing protein
MEMARRADLTPMLKKRQFHLVAERAVEEPQHHVLFDVLAKEAEDWAIFALDTEGHVTSWNVGAERMTGHRAEEITGEHFSILFSPDDRERGRPAQELHRAAAWGNWRAEGCAARKDGSVFWVNVATTALRDQTGAIRGFVRAMHDLTQMAGTKAALQLYMELSENLPNGVLVFRAEEGSGAENLRVLAANSALLGVIRLEGFIVEDLLGSTWPEVADVFPGLLEQDFSKAIWSVMASGKKASLGEVRRRTTRLPEAIFRVQAFPLPHQCVGVLFEDVTDAKRAEDAVRSGESKSE